MADTSNDELLLKSLRAERTHAKDLIKLLESTDEDPAKTLATARVLQAAQSETSAAIEELHSAISNQQRRTTERSIRQYVLAALEQIGTPQSAGFLDEFVLATEQVSLNTRGFGALRRDERRAWIRRPGHRVAYVVACLDPKGAPVSGWMARSDWDLSRRLVVPGAEDYWELSQLEAISRTAKGASENSSAAALELLLDTHVERATDRWPQLAEARAKGEKKFSKALKEAVESARQVVESAATAGTDLAAKTDDEKIWGWK